MENIERNKKIFQRVGTLIIGFLLVVAILSAYINPISGFPMAMMPITSLLAFTYPTFKIIVKYNSKEEIIHYELIQVVKKTAFYLIILVILSTIRFTQVMSTDDHLTRLIITTPLAISLIILGSILSGYTVVNYGNFQIARDNYGLWYPAKYNLSLSAFLLIFSMLGSTIILQMGEDRLDFNQTMKMIVSFSLTAICIVLSFLFYLKLKRGNEVSL